MASGWKIVAPIDLSRRPEAPVQHAIAVANALAADLDLLHVKPAQSHNIGQWNWPLDTRDGLRCGLDLRRLERQGAVAETIAAHAESTDADAVLITSRMYGRWNRLWRRSVTEDVLRLSRRPVCVTTASEMDGDFRFRNHRILCLVGLDGKDARLVRDAQGMADRTGAELVLLHVVPAPSEALLHDAVEGVSRPLSRQRAARQLLDLARDFRAPATTSVMMGSLGACAAIAAREHGVDLVMASRARPRIRGVHNGNIEDILPRLRCPLLTVPLDDSAPARTLEQYAAAGSRRESAGTIAESRMR